VSLGCGAEVAELSRACGGGVKTEGHGESVTAVSASASQRDSESAGRYFAASTDRADGLKCEFVQASGSEMFFDNGSVVYIRFFGLENVSFGKFERSFHRKSRRLS
jgi:hypothetical protein